MTALWYIFSQMFSDRICNSHETTKCILTILKWNAMFKEDSIHNKHRLDKASNQLEIYMHYQLHPLHFVVLKAGFISDIVLKFIILH